jgi:hypothetical protein
MQRLQQDYRPVLKNEPSHAGLVLWLLRYEHIRRCGRTEGSAFKLDLNDTVDVEATGYIFRGFLQRCTGRGDATSIS